MTPSRLPSPKPDYGIDAPGVVRNLYLAAAAGLAAYATARAGLWSGVAAHFDFAHAGLGVALGCGFMGTWMLYDSKIGKLKERETLLDRVALKGDERVLDVGCGRGLLLVGAAKRLDSGHATGLDLWNQEDLCGNSAEAALENARREDVAERVSVETGDMRKMPFAEASFDAIVSNMAIHNIYDREGRAQAMAEIARVLKPGGRLLIHDIRHIPGYAADLAALGLVDITRIGSRLIRLLLMVITFGSLRPDILTARKAER
jgi:SAM-dependent methyltransferase